MEGYGAVAELHMQRLFQTLNEKDRRWYAAVEAGKLGHGGIAYVSELFGIDAKTIRQGRLDLDRADDAAAGRVRKKGGKSADPRSDAAGQRNVSASHR